MSTLAVTNTLVDGATVQASEHNTNYSDIVTYINNRNSGAATWDAVSTGSATNIPLVVNNQTGTQDIARFQDNGTNALQIVNGGIVNMPLQSAARAYRNTSAQALSGNTKVQFNAESYDVQSEFDSSTNYVFTATADGVYLITTTLNITSPASAPVVAIYVDAGAVASYTAPDTTSAVSHTLSTIQQLTAAQTISVYANAGASGNVANGSGTSFVAIHKVA